MADIVPKTHSCNYYSDNISSNEFLECIVYGKGKTMSNWKIGYARVSTQDQNPTLQTDALTQAGCNRIYEEKASGAKRDRPELKQALGQCRPGDTLVVWKLDRLARSMSQLIETITDLEARDVGFISLTENIDTTSPQGKLMFGIFSSLAEFERSLIRERTMAGLAAAKAMGRTGGRPSSMTADKKKVIEALLTRSDLSSKEIAKQAGISVSTLYAHFPGAKGIASKTSQ